MEIAFKSPFSCFSDWAFLNASIKTSNGGVLNSSVLTLFDFLQIFGVENTESSTCLLQMKKMQHKIIFHANCIKIRVNFKDCPLSLYPFSGAVLYV
ncbi:hypothetical protein HanXRQr2_Chr11g0514251 [Helianthus annuus]|uniref:Uncharacterized protein n=1 Tax=Helianthus annuus TaxID=4232 RepID=A0A9K3N1V2_HELAN|nr:hypothetical protein HanXRQr2_Chr11g0514251 [Helianthus annuus]